MTLSTVTVDVLDPEMAFQPLLVEALEMRRQRRLVGNDTHGFAGQRRALVEDGRDQWTLGQGLFAAVDRLQ